MKLRPPSSVLDADTAAALEEAIQPEELTTETRDSMRARIFRRVRTPPPDGTSTVRSTDGTWTDLSPGVRLRILDENPNSPTRTYLVSMESGAMVPEHPHGLEEQCLVLEGEVWVGDHLLRSGDWHVAQPGSHHGNFSTRTGCLLLIKSEVFLGP
jgi:quercetin dioxygenase-like cupin family protein